MFISRRMFFGRCPGIAASFGGFLAGQRLVREARAPADPSLDALLQVVPWPESACLIGARYLDEYPDERSLDILRRRIAGGPRAPARESRRDGAGSCDTYAIAQRVRCDFLRGAVVRIGGWHLSRTEARVCALLFLWQRNV